MVGVDVEDNKKVEEKKLEKKRYRRVKMKIVVPVNESKGLNSMLSQHFGRAPFFMSVELGDEGNVVSENCVPNDSEHFGGTGLPPDRIKLLKPDAVVTYGMGTRAIDMFQTAKIAVLRTRAQTVKDVIAAYVQDELEELTEGCRH